MPLHNPRRAILVILELRGPQTAEYLARHVEGAAALLPEIERDGLCDALPDERWAFVGYGKD